MNLSDFCKKITKDDPNILWEDEKIGLRMMCPEYSISTVDVKHFPLSDKEEIFVLCWNVEEERKLYATIKPSKIPFAYSSTFVSGEKTQFHTHDYIELAYVVVGEFRQKILGKDIRFTKGEFCLIDKNCLHQDYLIDNNSTILFLGLANAIFDEVMVEKIGEERILNFLHTSLMKQKDIQQYLHFIPKDPDNNEIETMLLMLLKELECNDEASKYICKGLLIRILRFISSEYEFILSNEQRKKMNWLVFEEITNYIAQKYASITIKELVGKFHFNEDYYNRILKEKTGMTYLEYVQNLRLIQAEKYLKSTKMTVDDIANQVGYNNKGYFYKIFHERFGVTPAKYRKQNLNKEL